MTFQAPLHLQRLRLIHDRHLIYLPVTCRAADAFVYMNRVIEVREVRQVMHPLPIRAACPSCNCAPARDKGYRPNLLMAAHANRR
jgi:hypothetical protein